MHLMTSISLQLALVAGLTAGSLGVASVTGDRPALPDISRSDPANPPVTPSTTAADAAGQDATLKEASKTIDSLIDAEIAKQSGLKTQPKTRDDTFLRRIYLDLAGRIPTIEEAGDFLGSHKSGKREALVKKLLASEAHVSHMFTFWADMLRARSRLQDRFEGQPYIDWIKSSIRDNKPYDRMVYELICSQGPATSRGNGATGYYLADAGMQQDNMANTVRIFLGTRLSCAQCHDHPFDKWTRKDFFEMAAFTEGTDIKTNEGDIDRAMKGKGSVPYAASQIARKVGETLGTQVTNGNVGKINLPNNYQYKDARPGQSVNAMTMFKDDILKDAKDGVRDAYGKWMTSPSNPRFTLVIVNRIWKKLMRVGLVEPLDKFEDDTQPSNPALANYLVQLMKDVKYDLRKFQEVICDTNAYQRQAITGEPNRMKFMHEGQPLRRLSAEQMWDSLMTLTVPDVDGVKSEGAEPLYKFYEANKSKSSDELAGMVMQAGKAQDEIDDINKEVRDLRDKMSKGDKSVDGKIKDLEGKANGLRPAADIFTPYYVTANKNMGDLRRASELPSPMQPGHFLRVYGQSNRQVIDNSFDSMNLTQALELMNGMVESTILGSETSVLKQQLAKVKNMDDKVQVLYIAILSRLPTSGELDYGHKVMALAPNKRGIEYLGWALINSAEFDFNQ
jgi:hypothetical protein